MKVQDTGFGMEKDTLAKIFDRYNSKDEKINEKFEIHSSGIGLAYSKKLIELHNGTLIVDSVFGEGTIVTIQFPYDQSFYYGEEDGK